MDTIINVYNYNKMMLAIYNLMDKGESKLTELEIIQLKEMTIAVENYEDIVLNLNPR